MKKKVFIFVIIILLAFLQADGFAQMKKTAQSGMTYLSISLGARESAMGNASVASVDGVESIFYNPGRLADVQGLGISVNQVNWLADTKLYGLAAVYGFGRYGTVGVDLVYMDYGTIVGTQVVDKSVNSRGFIFTGDVKVQDYAFGIAYAYKVNERFGFGAKVKMVHEDLGDAFLATSEIDASQGLFDGEMRNWSLNHWGFDFGAFYDVGYKDLCFAVAIQNFSGDMKYWFEEFQMPLALRMGLSMDIARLFLDDNSQIEINTALDAIHPIDYTERIHVGLEFVYMKLLALRAGYKFNYDVENFSVGVGIKFDYDGYIGSFDYAYNNAEYFGSVNRFTLNFAL